MSQLQAEPAPERREQEEPAPARPRRRLVVLVVRRADATIKA